MTGTNNNNRRRVSVFIDGFNLYHSIDDLGQPHLKWLDLCALVHQFMDPVAHELVHVWYFSAYATWLIDAYARHQEYVKALEATGVRCVMGEFKRKDKSCPRCNHSWKGHEEKQSDVNLATYLLYEAHQNSFDEAFILSRDSDLTPAIRLTKKAFPQKRIKVLAPPNRHHSKELLKAADKGAAIQEVHLSRALFGAQVLNSDNVVVAVRPRNYDPPA